MASNGEGVLAFMAHPDDAEFLCAGTLARLKERGYRIQIATLTAGDGGSRELGPEEIARARRAGCFGGGGGGAPQGGGLRDSDRDPDGGRRGEPRARAG